MSNWCLHERTQLGAEGRMWKLSPEKELLVGTSSDCGVVMQSSQTVDSQHALLKWDQKNVSYMVKDLNSVNGTFVNNHPLRGTSKLLRHNDAIRFGLDRDHVFRMEECFSTPKSTRATMAESAKVPHVPVSVSMSPSCQQVTTPSSPSRSNVAMVTAIGQVPNQQDSTPPASQPVAPPIATPITTPQDSMVVQSHHQSPSSPSHTPHRHPDTRSKIQHALPISPTDGEESSLHRSDGRRAVGTENTPALNKASKLYGQPNWWGEEMGGDSNEARNRAFEFAKPGSQILRQLDPEPKKNSAPKLPLKADELRMQAISSSHLDPTSSWVIDFGNGTVTGTPPKMRRSLERGSRPRSADPSPNRVSTRRDPSPLTKRAVTPQYKRHSSLTSSSPRASTTPVTRKRATTPPVSRPKGQSTKKPPYGVPTSPKRKPLVKPLITPQQSTTPRSRSKPRPSGTPHSTTVQQSSPSHSEISKSGIPASRSMDSIPNPPVEDTSIDLKSLNEGTLNYLIKTNREEDTYTAGGASSDDSNSMSSLSDQFSPSASEKQPVVVTAAATTSGGDGMEGTSNRKQWVEEEEKPSADSLMMASIEARMRRLSKLAHQTARQVTALKNNIQDGHQLEVKGLYYLSLRDASPVVTRPEQNLPEWKFFTQEANSIFRNMRVVEKWLQDIDGTLNSIQPVDHNATSGEEGVDFASDGELYLDTRDIFESTSDGD